MLESLRPHPSRTMQCTLFTASYELWANEAMHVADKTKPIKALKRDAAKNRRAPQICARCQLTSVEMSWPKLCGWLNLFLQVFNHIHQAVNLFKCIVEGQRWPYRAFQAESAQDGLSAVVAGPDGDAGLV